MENEIKTSIRFTLHELDVLEEMCFRFESDPNHAEVAKELRRRVEMARNVVEVTLADMAKEALRKEEARAIFNRR